MDSGDKIFLAQMKDSEHVRVFLRLIAEAKTQMLSAIAVAKSSEHLLIAQGVIRGMNALENTLKSQTSIGEELIKQSEK